MKQILKTVVQIDPGMPGGDPDVPLDGAWLILLVLLAAVYGVRKIKSMQRH